MTPCTGGDVVLSLIHSFNHFGRYCIDTAFTVHNHLRVLVFNLGECVKGCSLLQSLNCRDCVEVHLTTPEWTLSLLGVRSVDAKVLMQPLNSRSSTYASKSTSCLCIATSRLSSFTSSVGTSTKSVLIWSGIELQSVHTLIFITLSTQVGLRGSLFVFLSKVVGVVLDGLVGLTLEELDAGLFALG